jgi:hypothetical protein
VAHEPAVADRVGGAQLHRGARRRRLRHDGDEDVRAHIRNANKQPLNVKDDKGVQMHTLSKDRDDSPNKIDAAMAAVLAWEAAATRSPPARTSTSRRPARGADDSRRLARGARAQLEARRPANELYSQYRDGDHRLRYATAKFRQAFAGLFREFADNWCELVVEAPVERLKVQGFRFGGPEADDDVWAMWQANNMDATSDEVHREAITCGEAYWLVEPPRNGASTPRSPLSTRHR